ncbi:hypothetical protein [Desulfotignum phosphitoxidans]|uniref:Uncharacterized protein n=1 Tax=Desulfotignum phosphitoxidans DSM 13687 TaxID=1286635 RepID=S0FWX8_9BACT|nr:hypothetical protein [Desulfotignum phosphitoxidans]EMS79205.1 hypothetical protein Dpo_5c01280 [Desulfotignum phosphitoxidans DSM 13687]
MLEKWLKHFFGEKILSSLMGILGGALSGVATVAVTGNLDRSALVTGAVGGAAAAVIGAGGRITGENKPGGQGIRGSGVMLVFMLVACLMAAGCAGTTARVGDGQVDAVETATIRLAVGAAMSVKPETIVPAYAVTKALLAVMDGTEAVQVKDLEKVLVEQIEVLNLTPLEQQSMADLVGLIRANIEARISGLAPGLQLVVVRAVVEIVHDAASARLNLVKAGV